MIGLHINNNKTLMLTGSILRAEAEALAAIMEENLVEAPINYLGLPLVSERFSIANCLALVEKATARISEWKIRFLSHARRLKLTKSVVSSFVQYWSRTFVLPKVVLHKLNMLSNKFIWEGSNLNDGIH